MRYLDKTFSVAMMANNTEPRCRCGEKIKIGYSTQEGMLCQTCYFNEKRKKEEELTKQIQNKV